MNELEFQHNDGGRSLYLKELGLSSSHAGDCVTRAIAIATKTPFNEVYTAMKKEGDGTASNGVYEYVYSPYLHRNFKWIKSGTRNYSAELKETGKRRSTDGYIAKKRNYFCGGLHVNARDLPMRGPAIVEINRHIFAMIDGVIHDTGTGEWRLSPDRQKKGTCVGGLCVEGIWRPKRYKKIVVPS
jgi:hypothetical protein